MEYNSNVKVSACIVTYKSAESVAKTIETLFEFTKGVDISLYIVDNASDDNIEDLINQKFSQYKIKLIKNTENIGFGAAHNKVLPYLKSDYHIILNPDIVFFEDTATALAQYLNEHSDVGMITPQILNPDKTVQYLPKKRPKFKYLLGGRFEKYHSVFKKFRDDYTQKNNTGDTVIDVEFCTGCFMMIRTSLLKFIGGFDDRYFMYFEDADLTQSVLKNNRVVYYPKVSVIHEWARFSSQKFKFLLIQINSMMKFFAKWG